MARVVILGGGYAGVTALRTLVHQHRGDLEIVLVDRHPYHYLQTEVYDFIANKTNISDITISLVALALSFGKNVQFLQRKIESIDFDRRLLIDEGGEELSYDYLILATGSRTFIDSSIPGLAERAHGVKSLVNALSFKQQFERAIYNKIEQEGICERRGEFHVVIGGAGLSGVEIATAMADYSDRLFSRSGFVCSGISITLISSGESILPGTDPFFVTKAQKKLAKLGVKIVTGKRVVEVGEKEIFFADDTSLPFDFLIWTGGIIGAPLIRSLELAKNRRHQLIVEPTLQLPGYPEVFVVGDAAELRDLEGRILPPTAYVAELSGRHAAENVILMMRGKPPRVASLKTKGMVVALGLSEGAAKIGSLHVGGFAAHLIKAAIVHFYRHPLALRTKMVLVKGGTP
ncbi:MAG: NAD(P)/FAD-dependent oxidoreductase [Campylobacterales bacterium]